MACLTGCLVGPDYRRPSVDVPTGWRSAPETAGSVADLPWWALFQDPTLQALIRTALAQNRDLQLAVARVLEARALVTVAQAPLFPQLGAGASYLAERYSEHSFPPFPPNVPFTQDFYQAQANLLSFEFDLWGRLRRATEAARADLLATEEGQRTVWLTPLADVAGTYFRLLGLDQQAAIARETLGSRREALALVQHRYAEGLTGELDARRAEDALAAAAAAVPAFDWEIAATENRLRVLLGENPGPIPRGAPLDAQQLPPEVPAGLPSALLARRPDVRQMEARLIAANARIGEAKALFFPQITLTGLLGVESGSLRNLFTAPSRIWQVGPTLTAPVFTGGRLQGTLAAAEAHEEQALIAYQQAIQQAFREVEDALVYHQKIREIRTAEADRVTAARQALQLAELRYENGLTNYLDVLDAQRQLFLAELDLAVATRDQLIAVVQLYKALGGGWDPNQAIGESTRESPDPEHRYGIPPFDQHAVERNGT